MKSTLAVLLLLTVVIFAARAKLVDDPLLRLCEDALRSSLGTLENYRRLDTSLRSESLSAEEHSRLLSPRLATAARNAGGEVERTMVTIRYRAGEEAKDRRLAQCEVLSVRNEAGDLLDRWLLLEGSSPGSGDNAYRRTFRAERRA